MKTLACHIPSSSDLTKMKKKVENLTEEMERLERKQRKYRWQNAVR